MVTVTLAFMVYLGIKEVNIISFVILSEKLDCRGGALRFLDLCGEYSALPTSENHGSGGES